MSFIYTQTCAQTLTSTSSTTSPPRSLSIFSSTCLCFNIDMKWRDCVRKDRSGAAPDPA